jgi:hypothetical protein
MSCGEKLWQGEGLSNMTAFSIRMARNTHGSIDVGKPSRQTDNGECLARLVQGCSSSVVSATFHPHPLIDVNQH